MKQQGFFEGNLGKYLIPPIILQSVLIGGGYATGREIVEYGAKYGAVGWIAGLAIALGFTIISILTFELARTFKVYDYKSFVKTIIGKFWPLYDLVYILLLLLIIAIMASATGEILQTTLSIPYWGGVIGVILVVGILHFFGERFIEKFKTYGTTVLYIAYLIFGFAVLSLRWDQLMATFEAGDTSFVGDISLGPVLATGLIYVGYNLAVYPASFFSLKRQTSRKESVVSGIISGLLMTIPWFLTYFTLMSFYPSEEVMEAPVPWLVMLTETHPALTVMFGIVMGWTLIETSTGIIHGFISRVDASIQDLGKDGLSRGQSSGLAVAILVIATILARFGIIDLVAQGYSMMAYGMIITFAIPLLTVGLFRILNPDWTHKFFE